MEHENLPVPCDATPITPEPYQKKVRQKILKRDLKEVAKKNRRMLNQLKQQRKMYSMFKPNPVSAEVAKYIANMRSTVSD